MGYVIIILIGYIFMLIVGKVREWKIISSLGFQTSVPPLFLSNEKFYHLTCVFIAILIPIIALFVDDILHGLVIVIVAWLIGRNSGKNKAFLTYRTIMKEGMEFAETDEDRKTAEQLMNQTDKELKQRLKEASKYS